MASAAKGLVRADGASELHESYEVPDDKTSPTASRDKSTLPHGVSAFFMSQRALEPVGRDDPRILTPFSAG